MFTNKAGAARGYSSVAIRKAFTRAGLTDCTIHTLTREALLDRTITMLIHDPMETMTRETIAAMIRAKEEGTAFAPFQRNLPFELYTQENI